MFILTITDFSENLKLKILEEIAKQMSYIGIGPEDGTVVEDNQEFDYALERCLNGAPDEQKEFREMLVEWFYSGNWVKEEDFNE